MKVVVFGVGYWGKCYLKELAGHVVAAVDMNETVAMSVRNTYNVKVFPELPDDLDYDAAIIATPPDTHIKLAKPILESGRQVLIEKPLAVSVDEAIQLYAYRKKIMVGHLYLYHPCINSMRQMVKEYPVDHIFCRRTNNGPIRPWLDAMWDLAPHDISIANHLFGCKPVFAVASGHMNWASMFLEYPGTDVLIYCSWLGGPKTRTIELVYRKGSERYIFDDTKVVLEVSPLRCMLDAFLSGEWDRCDFDSGIDVVDVLEKASLLG